MRKPTSKLLRVALLSTASILPLMAADVTSPGYLKYEYFGAIGTTPVSALTSDPRYIANTPDAVLYMPGFSTRSVLPDDSHDNYGARITGYIIPAETGDYDFFVSSDDASELWLSTDSSPANLQKIAEETACCHAFQEPGAETTTTTPIHLVAGQKYAVQALYKEGGGGDYMSVAWRKTDDFTEAALLQPIPGQFLAVDVPVATTLAITSQPQNVSVPAGYPAFFTVGFSGVFPPALGTPVGTMKTNAVLVQWYRDGVLIPGGVGPTYTLAQVAASDANAKFSAKIYMPGAAAPVTSSAATLSIGTTPPAPSPGFLMYEYFGGITTTPVQALTDDPRYQANTPDSILWMPSFDSRTVLPDDTHENYGARVTGFIVPTETASYDFFLRSDDSSELWLSTDESTANLQKIAEQTGCCNAFLEPVDPATGTPNAPTTQTPIALTAGKRYAVLALVKEGGGGDYIQVAWRKTTDSTPAATLQPIPGLYLASYPPPGGAITITKQPENVTVAENAPAHFSFAYTAVPTVPSAPPVGVMNTDPVLIQWYENGTAIPGANGTNLTIALTKSSDNNAKITARVLKPGATATTAEATLTISSDTVAPTLASAYGDASFTNITLVFSEPITAATAGAAANYAVDGGLTLTGVQQVNPSTVRLGTSRQTPGAAYTVTVNNLRDTAAGGGNLLAANTKGNFHAFKFSARGWLTFDYYSGIGGTPMSGLLTSPNFPDNPDTTYYATAFDSRTVFPDDSHENYGARMWGVFYPPETGDYRFFLSSDDSSQLYFNPSGSDVTDYRTGATPIAEETGCCHAFMEPGNPQTSEPVHLEAGKPYFIEGLLKEGGGGDYLRVAYRLETDGTEAASLQPIPGANLAAILDPDVQLQITTQPSNQPGVAASPGIALANENFNSGDGGFVSDPGEVPGPWQYDGTGSWVAQGGNDDCGTPNNSSLTSPDYTMPQDGSLSISFAHRYSFEATYDGGQVQISVNDGPFAEVPAASFQQNGYSATGLQGNGVLLGKRAFTGDSAGYAAGQMVTSVASLGSFKSGDKVAVRFLGAWDECTAASRPSWTLDSVRLDLLPMIIQSFASTNGGYTVQTTGTPPGPWAYDAAAGAWIAKGGNDDCGDPNNSALISPAYTVSQDDEVTLSFTHRYSFEAVGYDGGQVRVSVNGGPFTTVPAESFSANGYAADPIVGTGVLNGQRAFNGDSPGYASTNYVTSTAVLGKFKAGDKISIEFLGAWDECSAASTPSWSVKNVTLAIGKAAQASTFTAEATGTLHGKTVPLSYQWQRDDGSGYVDIPGANSASFRIFPVAADLNAKFRLVISTPAASLASTEVHLIENQQSTATLTSTMVNGKVSITFTGTLQSATNVAGPYTNVTDAQTSPYTPSGNASALFFRSVSP